MAKKKVKKQRAPKEYLQKKLKTAVNLRKTKKSQKAHENEAKRHTRNAALMHRRQGADSSTGDAFSKKADKHRKTSNSYKVLIHKKTSKAKK